MTNRIVDTSQRKAARVAGFGYLIIAILAIFANFFVLESLIVPGDAATTADNILASDGLFRAGIASLVVVVVLDVVVALALYILLKPVNTSLALLAAGFRLVFAAIFGVALVNLVLASELLGGADYLAVFEPDQLHSRVMFFINAFNYGWLIGLVFFGVHLCLLGYLIIKSGSIPRVLGVLLIVASLGYLIDSFANVLLSNYADYETAFLVIVAVPAVIAELAFTFWLLFTGVDVQTQDS